MIPHAHTARPLSAAARQILGASADAVEFFRRPSLPAGIRYALLLREPARPKEKPLAFASLGQLARRLHLARQGDGLQLLDAELLTAESPTPRRGVSVWILGEGADRRRFVGWAYLAGAGREALEAALMAEQPVARVG